MSDTCQPRITASCEEKTIVEAKEAGSCPEWDICLPFGGHLYSDGGCVHYEAGTPPPDGTYGTITITNGCISGLGPVRAPLYTEAACADIPASCDGSDSGGSGSCAISTQAGNMLDTDISGSLKVQLYTEPSSSVTLSGDGTADNPLRASMAAGAATTKVTATSPIIVSKSSNAYDVSHKKGKSTTVSGMEFDSWGHLIAYNAPTESSNSGVQGIIGDTSAGIQVQADEPSKGIYTLSLVKLGKKFEYLLGGYAVTADVYGRVTGATQTIKLTAGDYTLGDYIVSINTLGSIIGIKPATSGDTVSHGFAKKIAKNQSSVAYTAKPAADTGFLLTVEGGDLPKGLEFVIDGVSYDAVYAGDNKCFYVSDRPYTGKTNHTIEVTTGTTDEYITKVAALFTCMFVTV